MNIRYDIIKSSKSDQSYPVAETGQMATDCIHGANSEIAETPAQQPTTTFGPARALTTFEITSASF